MKRWITLLLLIAVVIPGLADTKETEQVGEFARSHAQAIVDGRLEEAYAGLSALCRKDFPTAQEFSAAYSKSRFAKMVIKVDAVQPRHGGGYFVRVHSELKGTPAKGETTKWYGDGLSVVREQNAWKITR